MPRVGILRHSHQADEPQLRHLDRLAEHAAKLARLPVDMRLVQAARNLTTTSLMVIARTDDVDTHGFATSLARPGGNITGLSFQSAALRGKRLEWLKAALPSLLRVAVLFTQGAGPQRKTLEHAALAAHHRLPAIDYHRRFAEAGGLMAYGPKESDPGWGWRRAVAFMDNILKGAKPADQPVEQPTMFELAINLKTAKAFSLTVPATLLFQADEVIQLAVTPGVPMTRFVLQMKSFTFVEQIRGYTRHALQRSPSVHACPPSGG